MKRGVEYKLDGMPSYVKNVKEEAEREKLGGAGQISPKKT